MSLSLVGICLGSKCLPLPSMGTTNTPSGRLWNLIGRFCCVGKTQSSGMFLFMSSGGLMLRSDNFSLLQASIVTIAEPSLPLLISSRTTKANCVVVSIYVHSFQSMVIAPMKYVWSTVWSSAQRVCGRPCRMAKPFGVLVCVYRVRPVLRDLFLLLRSHIWHGPSILARLPGIFFCWSWPATKWTWDVQTFGVQMVMLHAKYASQQPYSLFVCVGI